MVIYSTRRRGGRGLAYILYVCVREQVHLTQCRDFLVSEARATSKLWNWLFKHHTTPLWATCMHAVVILARTLTCDASICGPTRPSSMHVHHFDLHQERLINFTIDEDSFGLYIYYGRSIYIVCGEEGGRGPSYVVRFMKPRSVWVHGLRFLRHVAHQSCAFWVFNIYMFGPHAKRWWLSSRTHLSGYQRYRCFPSVGPLGPSLLFAWQQERLIWLRRGLFFCL